MTRVAAALVTHNAERWLEPLLASIESQTRPPDRLIVVDDASTDATREILRDHGIEPLGSGATGSNVKDRTASNFTQAVLAGSDVEVVVLGDHDDMWHRERVARQVRILEDQPAALMVASDGGLVDEAGAPMGGTLRTAFPVPTAWESWDAAMRMSYALRRSVATGGASALRPAAFPELTVPRGWLHDRWWSLVACARGGLVIDEAAVIDYRVTDEQQVGLAVGAQSRSGAGRLRALAKAPDGARRALDLRRLRSMASTPEIAKAVTLRSVLGT